MKNLLFSLTFLSISFCSVAQNVGINTTGATPDPSAALDIDYTDKGLLIPRVALTSTTDILTIPAPTTSLLVYNNNVAMTGGSVGYWYWDGAAWVQAIGPQGPAGANGTNGAIGPQGPIGPAGANGTNGAIGPQGPIGPAGANGTNGAIGPQGPVGPAGANGTNGAIGPQGPVGPAGANGTNGAVGPQGPVGPAGAAGATNMNGITLAADVQVTSATYANVPGMSFAFTAQTTSAVVIFSASGFGFTNSMAFVQFRIRNNGATIGSTQTKIQSYDDVTGTITLWSCTYTRYVTGLVVGNNYTLDVQGQVGGIFGTNNAAIFAGTASGTGHHMSLNVIQ